MPSAEQGSGTGPQAYERDLAANALVLGLVGTLWFGWAQEGPPAGWAEPLAIGSVVGTGGVAIVVGAAVLAISDRRPTRNRTAQRGGSPRRNSI